MFWALKNVFFKCKILELKLVVGNKTMTIFDQEAWNDNDNDNGRL